MVTARRVFPAVATAMLPLTGALLPARTAVDYVLPFPAGDSARLIQENFIVVRHEDGTFGRYYLAIRFVYAGGRLTHPESDVPGSLGFVNGRG